MRPVLRSLWLAIHLAIGLCSSAPEAFDLTDESQATLDMYGIGLPAGSHKLTGVQEANYIREVIAQIHFQGFLKVRSF
jgi:hypothetical protein